MNENTPEELTHRRIRSYVLRQGRLTKGQEKALADNWPKFGIDYVPEVLDLSKAFGRQESSKVLEIGFGMGETTARISQSMPERDFLGVEVHTPGVGGLLKLIGELSISNVRIIQHDAVDVLNNMIADASLDGIHIFFPDPWHKKRHHKRRLIQSNFVRLLCSKLKSGGYLHVATDWEEYAEWVLEILKQEPLLTNSSKDYATKPAYRPLTKFENRGIKLGHGVWDLIFIRN